MKGIVLLPLADNDKKPFPQEVINGILDEFYVLCRGYYIAGRGEGAYRMKTGTRQDDVLIEVWIAFPDDLLLRVRALVAQCAVTLQQETIYFEIQNSLVEFIPPPTTEGQ